MAWSTREVAELAGTTLRAVRHYHDVGLLPVPDRDGNGYKRYETHDLLALLRIRRLVDLGLPLSEVASLLEREDAPLDALRQLDAQLEQEELRIHRTRDRIALVLEDARRTDDLVVELAPFRKHDLTEPDRSFLVLLARIVTPRVLEAYVAMLDQHHDSRTLARFDALETDAPEAVRAELAAQMTQHLTEVHTTYPALRDLTEDSPVGPERAISVLRAAFTALYNSAQLDVLRRTSPRA